MMVNAKEPKRYEGVENRVQWIALGLTAAFCMLVFQLRNLQVVRLSEFQEMAEDNRIRPERLKSDRGVIYGRNGVVLADNRASCDIMFVPGECPNEQREEVCHYLEKLVGVNAEDLLKQVSASKGAPFTQLTVKKDVSTVDRVRVEEHSHALPGVFTLVSPQRRYHYGATGGQIMGYLAEIGQKELDSWKTDGYYMGDLIGWDGLERQYEKDLHGQDGYMLVTKYASGRPQLRTDTRGVPYVATRDSDGNLLAEERRREPRSGDSLYLSLDIDLQAKAEALLRDVIGSIVVLDEEGRVLAMASSPGYDPSVFVQRGLKRERGDLLNAPRPSPMQNRCYKEQYPPGSVFKVMLAAAALEEGLINRDTTYYCPGSFRINGAGRAWRCHKHAGHGTVNVVDALTVSCDVFFYNVGLQLGVDKIKEWSTKLGLGIQTGLDLPGEITGLIPDPDWKKVLNKGKNQWEQKWYPGDTVNLSIGQGSAATTPLQNAVMMNTIINGGRRIIPHLKTDNEIEMPQPCLSQKTLDVVIEGMRNCVEDKNRGTGRPAQIDGMIVLGKTGTAQVVSLKHSGVPEDQIPYEERDHAWFVAGVLDREPKISMCILVEHGLHGGSTSAPLAKEIIEYFYANEAARLNNKPLTIAKGAN